MSFVYEMVNANGMIYLWLVDVFVIHYVITNHFIQITSFGKRRIFTWYGNKTAVHHMTLVFLLA